MKAIAFQEFGGPDVLELIDLPKPVPEPGEALIKVLAAGTGHGDCKLRQGALQAYFDLELPKIPGRDGIGTIEAFGGESDALSVGDRVCFLTSHNVQGSCAEFITRPTAGLVAVPDNLGTVTAMAVAQPGCCAWISIETAKLQAGETILVHGAAGAIGSLVVLLAKHRGARVIATCRSTAANIAKDLGADEVVSFDQEDPFKQIGPVDVVFDPVGGETHRRSYDVLKRGGRLVYLTAEPIVDLSAQYGVTATRAKIEDNPETLRKVMESAAAGILRPLPPRQFPFENCAYAHQLLESGQQGPGRVILTVN